MQRVWPGKELWRKRSIKNQEILICIVRIENNQILTYHTPLTIILKSRRFNEFPLNDWSASKIVLHEIKIWKRKSTVVTKILTLIFLIFKGYRTKVRTDKGLNKSDVQLSKRKKSSSWLIVSCYSLHISLSYYHLYSRLLLLTKYKY